MEISFNWKRSSDIFIKLNYEAVSAKVFFELALLCMERVLVIFYVTPALRNSEVLHCCMVYDKINLAWFTKFKKVMGININAENVVRDSKRENIVIF